MSRIDAALRQAAHTNPEDLFPVIVRVEGDLDARQTQLEANGLTVTRRLWLIRGFACSATGSAIEAAAACEWIISIEPDMQIRTMDSGSG
ncbi:MAG: hypothetical protein B6D41_07055 [Chloroflexi bacterium UTCFX4]|jgi:hypothetical protein|nr:MAG: hypothetical protein B6D41_07055 [Chloroflexi bacterium UTCFX4]